MRTLFFDCFAGASGNMVLGALIDLGIDRDELLARLNGLDIPEFSLEFEAVDRSGIAAVHVEVKAPDEKKHRHLHHIEAIIEASDLSQIVKERSKAIFRRLAEAEARVHGIDIQKVHFHEVGAVDAIVDVVGSCLGFEMLGIEHFACSKLHVGSGFVNMEHGKYPVPPPAVAKLLEGVPSYSTEIEGELLTPTGAAIITMLCQQFGPMPELTVERSGYGAGTRIYVGFPNVLRLILGEGSGANILSNESGTTISEQLILLETNIDDMPAQAIGFVTDRAMDEGALDCWVTPIQMKKNRPAILLSLLCSKAASPGLQAMLFAETTTLGIRSSTVDRISLPREVHAIETIYGRIEVKTAEYRGRTVNVMPEYEQVKRAALEHRVPFRQVHAEVIAAFKGSARSVAR